MRYHLTPIRMAIINKSTNKCWMRMWRKGYSHTLLVGMQTDIATVESSMKLPQKNYKCSCLITQNSTSENLPKKPKTLIWRNICTPMFIAALFIIAKIWKQPKRPSVHEWMKQLWDIYTMEHYLAIKRRKSYPLRQYGWTWRVLC